MIFLSSFDDFWLRFTFNMCFWYWFSFLMLLFQTFDHCNFVSLQICFLMKLMMIAFMLLITDNSWAALLISWSAFSFSIMLLQLNIHCMQIWHWFWRKLIKFCCISSNNFALTLLFEFNLCKVIWLFMYIQISAIPEQKETISHSLTYIRRACGESIENPIQKQIDRLQSQTNNKLKIILQLVQQNAEDIKKRINAKQMTENSQTLQKAQVSQTSQVMQNSQKPTQKLTYAQKAAQVTDANANANTNANANANAGEWNLVTKKFSPKSQEISYRERRLIVNPKNENWTLKAMEMRDSMNNALKKAKIDLRVVTVAKTLKENNIALMISEKYIADALLAQRAIWEHVFDVKSIKKDEKWHKIVIHSLETEIFNMETEMEYLRTELEKYNPELKLITNSIWLSKGENKARKNHASAILTFKTEAEAQRHLKKRLLAARSTYRTVEYRDYRSNDQCQKCQTFEHLQNKCNRSSRCLYCERNHQIWNHKCQLPTCKDEQPCNHTISRCCNCQNAHFANSAMCKTYQTAQSISSQKDHLVTEL